MPARKCGLDLTVQENPHGGDTRKIGERVRQRLEKTGFVARSP